MKETELINFQKLHEWCRNDNDKFMSYLAQFDELMSKRLNLLLDTDIRKDRGQVKAIFHKMRPLLTFFGLAKTSQMIGDMELDIDSLTDDAFDLKINLLRHTIEQNLAQIRNHKDSLKKNEIKS